MIGSFSVLDAERCTMDMLLRAAQQSPSQITSNWSAAQGLASMAVALPVISPGDELEGSKPRDVPARRSARRKRSVNGDSATSDEVWPDGDGSFHLEGATPLSTSNIVDDQNSFDFTRGIVFKQVRANAQVGRECYAGHVCYDDRSGLENPGNETAFGYGAAEGHLAEAAAARAARPSVGGAAQKPVPVRAGTEPSR